MKKQGQLFKKSLSFFEYFQYSARLFCSINSFISYFIDKNSLRLLLAFVMFGTVFLALIDCRPGTKGPVIAVLEEVFINAFFLIFLMPLEVKEILVLYLIERAISVVLYCVFFKRKTIHR